MQNVYLITGATGFIGTNIVRQLIKQEQGVAVIVRDKRLNWRLNDIASKLDIYECDLLSNSLGDLVEKIRPDFIFHLATYGMLAKEDDSCKMIDINLKGTINLVNAAKKISLKLFINTGSCFEYGNKSNPMKETDFLEPLNDYSVIKSAVTLYCQKEAIRSGIPIINFRLFTPYGYFEDNHRLIPSVVRSAIVNEPIKVSVPESVRDFVFIEDVVNAYIQAVKMSLPNGSIFNIGSGRQYNVGQIIKIILRLSKSNSKVLWGAVRKQDRYIEPTTLRADLSKTRKMLQWSPRDTIWEGLGKTIEWFKKNRHLY